MAILVKLAQMGSNDDPQGFLTIFEWVASAVEWALEHWAVLVVPRLSRLAQTTYWKLDSASARDYAKLRDAILDYLDITEETLMAVPGRGVLSRGGHKW